RPVGSDGLLVLGGVPALDRLYVATGGARKGILYGPAMGHAIASLVLGRDTRVSLDQFAPGRFTGAREAARRTVSYLRRATEEPDHCREVQGRRQRTAARAVRRR